MIFCGSGLRLLRVGQIISGWDKIRSDASWSEGPVHSEAVQ